MLPLIGLNRNYFPVVLGSFLYLILKLFSLNTGMFWDSVNIVSAPATYLFNNGLFQFNYPPSLNNGDPQLVSFYLALVWKLFGRSLLVSQLAFFPVMLITLWQLHQLAGYLFRPTYASWVWLLIVVDPTLMAQLTGMYQDAFLIMFSAIILNAILRKNAFLMLFAMLFLCMVSRRGILIVFAFMIANYVLLFINRKESFLSVTKKVALIYLPSIIFVVSFVFWRLHTFQWFFTTESTQTGQLVPLEGVLRNGLVLGRWFLDCGRIFLWIGIIYAIPRVIDKKSFVAENKSILILFISLLLVMMAVTLPIANPFGARYFAVHYILLSILFSGLLIKTVSQKRFRLVFMLSALLILLSNFWVYPQRLSYPWDSSLKHLPYYRLRVEATSYLEKAHIPLSEVGVGFPMFAKFSDIDISNDNREFSEIDLSNNNWVIYSNISNLSDNEIAIIESWNLVKEYESNGVFMRIYRRK